MTTGQFQRLAIFQRLRSFPIIIIIIISTGPRYGLSASNFTVKRGRAVAGSAKCPPFFSQKHTPVCHVNYARFI